MSSAVDKYWQLLQCYKGFLPGKDAAVAQSYVVVALRSHQRHHHHHCHGDNDNSKHVDDENNGHSATSTLSSVVRPHRHHHHTDATTCTWSNDTSARDASNGTCVRDDDDDDKASAPPLPSVHDTDDSNHHHHNSDGRSARSRSSRSSNSDARNDSSGDSAASLSFYLYRKCDVSPPPLQYILSPKKLAHCFVACEATHCTCDAPHVRAHAWRLRVDALAPHDASMLVCERGRNRRVLAEQLLPTAGYYFALGLLHVHAVLAVMPVLCRYNATCKHGSCCLYIHTHTTTNATTTTTTTNATTTAAVMARPVLSTSPADGEAKAAATTAVTDVALPATTTTTLQASQTSSSSPLLHTADVLLRQWDVHTCAEVLPEATERAAFFDYMDAQGLVTVGDVQGLGVTAFELLASRVPARWAQAFLAMTVFRTLDRKASLWRTLLTFPRVLPSSLSSSLSSLRTVGDVLRLSPAQFYALELPPHVMDACEALRSRGEADDEYAVVTLASESPCSFFVRVTDIVVHFRTTHAHCSWRKHDPARPVVTSLFTYVDVAQCHCSGSAVSTATASGAKKHNDTNNNNNNNNDNNNNTNNNNDNNNNDNDNNDKSDAVAWPTSDMVASPAHTGIGVPPHAWCVCERRWVIAVNYELSTPSGSRCSEQNAMGKLASSGVPTWAVREVFVHGHDTRKEVNPLFPCGVCENMLQKVTRDVYARYGGEVTLYMFDAREPRRLVFLPLVEMSHRAGTSFRRFVEHDLRAVP